MKFEQEVQMLRSDNSKLIEQIKYKDNSGKQ